VDGRPDKANVVIPAFKMSLAKMAAETYVVHALKVCLTRQMMCKGVWSR
jgi:hypothetical protein